MWIRDRGTTVNFETDEDGRITKITNFSKIKKQAKALVKASMKYIAAMPIMQAMKKAIGLDFMKIGNQANTDELVEEMCIRDRLYDISMFLLLP